MLGGLTRFAPGGVAPRLRLARAQIDTQEVTGGDIPTIAAGQRVTFEIAAIDFATLPEKRRYRYRIAGVDSAWTPAPDGRIAWTPQQAGSSTFEVQALDRSLNASDPLRLTVKAPKGEAVVMRQKDAKKMTKSEVLLLPAAKLEAAGEHKYTAEFRFSVCTEKHCELKRKELTWVAKAQ